MHSAPDKSQPQKSFISAESPKELFKHSGITNTWLSGTEWQPNAKHSALKHCMRNRDSCLRDQNKFPIVQKDKRFQTWSFLFFKEVNILAMTGASKRSLIYKEWEDAKNLENLSNYRKLTWLLFFNVINYTCQTALRYSLPTFIPTPLPSYHMNSIFGSVPWSLMQTPKLQTSKKCTRKSHRHRTGTASKPPRAGTSIFSLTSLYKYLVLSRLGNSMIYVGLPTD